MEIRCTACEHLIPAPRNDDETLDLVDTKGSVVCPNCGSVQLPRDSGGAITETLVTRENARTPISHFLLARPLGQGSFGTVWLVNDTILDRQVALKITV